MNLGYIDFVTKQRTYFQLTNMHGVSHLCWHFCRQWILHSAACWWSTAGELNGEVWGDCGFWLLSVWFCGWLQWGVGAFLLKTSVDFVIKGLSLPFYNLKSNASVYIPLVKFQVKLAIYRNVCWEVLQLPQFLFLQK